jgi:hypothetical protein
MLIWRTDLKEPVNIRASLNNEGAGQFGLWRFTPQGSYEPAGMRTDGTAIDGDAHFGFSAEQLAAWQWQPLSLRLGVTAFHPGDAKMSVFLLLDQPGGKLRPEDAVGNSQLMQANGVELKPALGHNDGRVFDFLVYFW